MATTGFKGPLYVYGMQEYLPAALVGTGFPQPEYNQDLGPSVFAQGTGLMDVRQFLQKDKLSGFGAVCPAYRSLDQYESCNVVPSAFGTAKIAALAHTTTGTALTLVSTAAAGITLKVPFVQWNQAGTANSPNSAFNGGTVVVVPIMLDFGFAFGTVTSGSATVTVADSTDFLVGMPIVFPAAAGGGNALLTYVASITDATHIVLADKAGANVTAGAIGHGNVWPGAPTISQTYSNAHAPYTAGGPGLFFNGGEGLARAVSITTGTGGSGGNVVVSGWDVYGQVMNETIAASATSATVYGKKAFKGIKSVTPAFTDGTGTYSVGTTDVFGFNLRANRWELTRETWAGASVTTNVGFTAWVAAASGDVRGTFQASAQGGGTGYGSTNSNGSVSSLVMTGNRLFLSQALGLSSMLNATILAPQTMFGPVQT
jgi:hypothetical protein